MSVAPDVTVLMAVHNAEPYVRDAVTSVLDQDFRNFEFVIVDDGCTDGSSAILDELARADPRIVLIRNAGNRGLTASLNVGLRAARGRYIARMDADDRSLPHRLSRQFDFMERHPDHAVVASGYRVIDADGRVVRTAQDRLDDWQIRWLCGFYPPVAHPTYFFRCLAPDGSPWLYDESFATAQDFDLLSRLSETGRVALLPDILLMYRRHEAGITVRHRKAQTALARKVGERNLRQRLPADVMRKLEPLLALFAGEAELNRGSIAASVAGCDALLRHDLATAPTCYRRWLRRAAAGILAEALLSRAGGLRKPAAIAEFLWQARRHLWPLAAEIVGRPGIALKSLRAVRRTA